MTKQRRLFSEPVWWVFLGTVSHSGYTSQGHRNLVCPAEQVSIKYLLNDGALTSCLINQGPYSSTKLPVSTLCQASLWSQEAGKGGSLPPSLLRDPSPLPWLGSPASFLFPEQPAACLSSLRSASQFPPACPSRSLIQ